MPILTSRLDAALDALEHDHLIQVRTVHSAGRRDGRPRREYRLDLGQADPPEMTRDEAIATARESKRRNGGPPNHATGTGNPRRSGPNP